MKKRWFGAVLVLVAGGGALYMALAATPAPKDQPRTAPPSAAVRPNAARSAPVVVATAAAESSDFAIRRRTIGTFESPASVNVRARIDSQVVEQHFVDGQMVKKGDLLYTLDARELKATIARDQAQLEKDQATLARTAAALKRTQDLAARNVASQQALDQATADHKSAEATVAADQAQLDIGRTKLSFTTITAPIAGRLGASRVTPGSLVSAGDSGGLVTVTQIAPIRLAFTLPESDVPDLRAALDRPDTAPVRAHAPGQTTPLATGRLSFVDSAIDTSTGTILAKAAFPNTELTLWPGQYVDVEIDLETRPNTVTVPTVAIQTGQQGPYVFVVRPDQTVERRNVTPGGINGDRTAIVAGLAPDEPVVIEGQLRLADGARIRDGRSGDAARTSREAERGTPGTPATARE